MRRNRGRRMMGEINKLTEGSDGTLDIAAAAENEAEFFAVMSEAFFLDPLEARRRYPGVYGQLVQF